MKRTLLLIVAVILVVAACVKKQEQTHCYVCNRYVVKYSNYPALTAPLTLLAKDTICNMNDGLLSIYVKEHMHLDTLYKGHDTFVTGQFSSQCDLQ